MKLETIRPMHEAMDEVERELNVRKRCFPKWIEDGRLSRTDARDRLARQQAALDILTQLNKEFPDCVSVINPTGQQPF
jgi:hypothetical protein